MNNDDKRELMAAKVIVFTYAELRRAEAASLRAHREAVRERPDDSSPGTYAAYCAAEEARRLFEEKHDADITEALSLVVVQ